MVCPSRQISWPPFVNEILAMGSGIAVLSGGPGCGKTFTTKKLTRLLRAAGKTVHLSASTGAAAVRLSHFATTNHCAFNLPIQHLPHMPRVHQQRSVDVRAQALQSADVFIIDEFSMVTAMQFMQILMTVFHATQLPSVDEMLRQKLFILVGDDAQVRGVH